MSKRKLILKTKLSPGDLVTLTAAIRDLHHSYPDRFITDVRVTNRALFENNPFITPISDDDPLVEIIDMHYPLVHESNQKPFHFIHGYRMWLEQKLNLPIKQGVFKGDIYISDQEKKWKSQVDEIMGQNTKFWIIVGGGKTDFTTKWWDESRYQEVVDHFKDKILFVQTGEAHHQHPPLRNTLNLIGKTKMRQFIRLMYHAQGVICPITFAMHLSAAVPVKAGGRPNRPCVVLGGGREAPTWEMYPTHQYIHTVGMLPCCATGGCWKSRVVPLGDGDKKDTSLCVNPIEIRQEKWLPKCMDMITPKMVINAVEGYLEYDNLK